MRAVIQRVKKAGVSVDGYLISSIKEGLLILVGIKKDDDDSDISYIVEKTLGLRIFMDDFEKMNLSVLDKGFEVLIVSQFTLYGDVRHGKRPSFSDALASKEAEILYERLLMAFKKKLDVKNGVFGADMDVELINDGPVTILLDSKRGF